MSYLCNAFEKNKCSGIGSLDEWLSQRSAKPCTAVRIRQEPPHHFKNKYAKGNNLWIIPFCI